MLPQGHLIALIQQGLRERPFIMFGTQRSEVQILSLRFYNLVHCRRLGVFEKITV